MEEKSTRKWFWMADFSILFEIKEELKNFKKFPANNFR
jgi:hypothetical protein